MTIKKRLSQMANISRDGKYEYLAGFFGLYHIAFFGHKATKQQRAKLRYLWKCVMLYN